MRPVGHKVMPPNQLLPNPQVYKGYWRELWIETAVIGCVYSKGTGQVGRGRGRFPEE